MSLKMRELVILVIASGVILAAILPYGRAFSRAGYSPWLCILMLVPLVNVIAMWVFACAEWPALTARSR